MYTMKSTSIFIAILVILFSFFLTGCYTQFSHPDVDTEYYPEEDEEYDSEYYDEEEDVDISYYDIYVYGGPPIYFGPNVWRYWSPYYRWHHNRGFYDPWWYYDDFYWGYRIYDPFWDPWYDDWWYHNYYYYHPRHYYYWTYEDGHRYWHSKPSKQRDFERRDPQYVKSRSKKRGSTASDKVVDDIRKRKIRDKDVIISKPDARRQSPDSIKKPKSTRRSPEVRKPKRNSEPRVITKPKDKNRVYKPSKEKTKRGSTIKSPPKRTSRSSGYRPSSNRSKPSVKAPAPKSKSSGSKGSSSSKSSDKRKK